MTDEKAKLLHQVEIMLKVFSDAPGDDHVERVHAQLRAELFGDKNDASVTQRLELMEKIFELDGNQLLELNAFMEDIARERSRSRLVEPNEE